LREEKKAAADDTTRPMLLMANMMSDPSNWNPEQVELLKETFGGDEELAPKSIFYTKSKQ
jgi:hypothetical protein